MPKILRSIFIIAIVYNIFIFRSQSFASDIIYGSSCQIAGANFSIKIGNIFEAPDMPTPISFSCNGLTNDKLPTYGVKKGYKPVYCYHIHGGLKNPSGYPYREARKGLNKLYFSLKADTGIWGYQAIGSVGLTPYTVAGVIPWDGKSNSVSWSNNVTMHFEGNNPNISLPDGSYRYSASNLHMVVGQIPEDEELTKYNACGNASEVDWGVVSGYPYYKALDFNIEVATYCNIDSTSNLNFGKATNLQNLDPAHAVVNVNCSAGTHYEVEINKGLHYDNTADTRRMASQTGEYINYAIDRDFIADIGTGIPSGTNHVIKGSVPDQNPPLPGSYRDTLVVTLTNTSVE